MAGNISQTTAVRASKVRVVLWIEPSHMLPKFRVRARKVLKCLKLEKQSNLTFIISRTATARASKVCVVLCLELRSTFPKFGVWTTHSLEILKVRKIVNMTYLSEIPLIYYISINMTLQDPREIRKKIFGNDIFMNCDKLCFKFSCMNLDIGQIYQPKSW